jgi:hypothetical protein
MSPVGKQPIDRLRRGVTAHQRGRASGNARKPPDEWVTGDEPMTGAQASYLATLARHTGREVPESLAKAELPADRRTPEPEPPVRAMTVLGLEVQFRDQQVAILADVGVTGELRQGP